MDMATSATSEAMRRAGSAPSSSSSSSPSDSGTDFVSESELLPLLLDTVGVDAADDEPFALARLPLLREGSWASSSSAANACGAPRRPPLKNLPSMFRNRAGVPWWVLPLHDVAEHDPALAPAGRGERASLEKGAANTATTPVEAQLSTSIAPKTVDRASKIPTRPWGVFCQRRVM